MLHAKSIYRGRIPDGEEKYLFQYHILKINDEATATLSFDNKYVEEGGTTIGNYVGRTGDDRLESYDYKSHFKHDHKLYNHYNNNIANAELNEKNFAALKAEQEEKKSAIEDTAAFELLTRKERKEDLDFDTCYAHQCEQSGGYASGTLKF